jgi:hypothetical protein
MKLWFEGWNVNADDVLPLQRMPHRPLSSSPSPQSAVKIDLADERQRGRQWPPAILVEKM